LVLIYHLFVK